MLFTLAIRMCVAGRALPAIPLLRALLVANMQNVDGRRLEGETL